MKQLYPVPQTHIDQAWRDGASLLGKACDTSGGEVTGDQLKMMLARGERQLLVVMDDAEKVGWVVIRIDQLPNVRALHVCELYAPGAMFEECWGQLQELARSNGCSEIRCSAKPAQARLYRMRFGFEPVYETLKVSL
ncbi:MAG: hypothetical protein ACM3VZ_11370 [Acidobacteriota bacterium]